MPYAASTPPPAPPWAPGDPAELFARQQAQRPVLRRTTAAERRDKLKRLDDALLRYRSRLHDALHADFHKPGVETDLSELAATLAEVRFARRHLRAWMRPQRVASPVWLPLARAEVRYEPRGTALILSPWNYPVLLTLGPLVSAIAAGCPAVLKPSEYTPHTTRVLAMLLSDLFPPEEVAVFEGDHTMAQALLALPFDHVHFTGSPAVGRLVMAAAARHLASVTLELGGKSPTLVDATVNPDEVARKLVFGKFTNAGQTCVAPDHVYVHRSVYPALVAALRAALERAYGPDETAWAGSPHLARCVSRRHFERVTGLLDAALEAGATCLAGGARDATTLGLAPTLVGDLPPGTALMQEEIFGPVLPLLPYDHLDNALADIRTRPNPLALYVFSRDRATVEHVLANTTAGGTTINDTLLHYVHPMLPTGGAGHSGIGRAGGLAGFRSFSNERAVLRQRLRRVPLELAAAPYGRWAQRLARLLLRLV